MVHPSFLGSLVTRALLALEARLDARAESKETYAEHTNRAVIALQKWYSTSTGLWTTTGWWNSGNVLTMLSDFAALDRERAASLGLEAVFENTFTAAQKTTQSATKIIAGDTGLVQSHYMSLPALPILPGSRRRRRRSPFDKRGFSGFINEYYDDEGWWALGWIRAFDVYGTRKYLDMAEAIFEDMRQGTDDVCGGGIWWSKEKKYKNAIANELYLSVAASLANRDVKAHSRGFYRSIATAQWAWLKASGMLNTDNLWNDGLTILSNGTCVNNGGNTWTYNQGVVLGGLVELTRATAGRQGADGTLLDSANKIASAAIAKLSKDGILTESCEPSNCGGDGPQFKGIFVRNLRALAVAQPGKAEFRDFIFRNADSIWQNARNETTDQIGLVWAGPWNKGREPGADTQSSAMDVLVAAVAIAS